MCSFEGLDQTESPARTWARIAAAVMYTKIADVWCWAYSEAGIGGQQLKAILHVDELSLDGPIVAAKVVQRCIQLLQARDSSPQLRCFAHGHCALS